MRTKVLLCGATGFIGRNMLEFFSKNKEFDIRATSYKRPKFDVKNSANEIEWVKGDLRDPSFVNTAMQNVDIVIQCAATTSGSKDIVNTPYLHVTDNAVMNSLLLRSAHDNKVSHFIFFSCTVMYPSSVSAIKEIDFDNNTPLHERYFGVGHTKLYIERMLEFYSKIFMVSMISMISNAAMFLVLPFPKLCLQLIPLQFGEQVKRLETFCT